MQSSLINIFYSTKILIDLFFSFHWWLHRQGREQSDNGGSDPRPRTRQAPRSVLYRHQGHRQRQLWRGVPGEALRDERTSSDQKSVTG